MSRHHGLSACRDFPLALQLRGAAQAACRSSNLTSPRQLGACPGTRDFHTPPYSSHRSPREAKKDTERDENTPAPSLRQPALAPAPQRSQPELGELFQVTSADARAEAEVSGALERWGFSPLQCSHHLRTGELSAYK